MSNKAATASDGGNAVHASCAPRNAIRQSGRTVVHLVCRSASHGDESVFAFCRDESDADDIAAALDARHASCANTYSAVLPEEDYDDAELALAKWKDAYFTAELQRAQLADAMTKLLAALDADLSDDEPTRISERTALAIAAAREL